MNLNNPELKLARFLRLPSVITSIFAIMALLSSPVLATPDVSLEGLDGRQHNLSDYIGHGKWVVLNLWGTRCPPCQEEMPELVMFHENHMDDDAIVVGIAIDFPSFGYANKEEVATFVEEYFIDFPILLSDSSVTHKFAGGALRGLPTTYMFSPEGELIGHQVGGINAAIIERFIKTHNKEAPKTKK